MITTTFTPILKLYGRVRAIGIGVKHVDDVVEIMAKEGKNELNSPIAQQPCQPCQRLLSTSSAIEPHY